MCLYVTDFYKCLLLAWKNLYNYYFVMQAIIFVLTRLQLLLAMTRNLSIGTRSKKESEGEKSAKKG